MNVFSKTDKDTPCRPQTVKEEIGNAISHGVGAALFVAATVLMIVFAARGDKGATAITSVSIFGGSLILLYLTSCLYHSLTGKGKRVFKILDHNMIYVLILGTYTPICLSLIKGPLGIVILSIDAACSIVGIVLNSIDLKRFDKVSQILYIILHYLQTKDTTLRRQVLLCLSYIAQNSPDKAIQIINSLKNQNLEENIGGTEKLSAYNISQGHVDTKTADEMCQQNALTLLYNIANHGQSPANQVSAKIKCETLIKFLETNKGKKRNAGLQLLATLVKHSKEQAQQIIRLQGHKVIAMCLCESNWTTIYHACEAVEHMASLPEPDITNKLVEKLAIGVDDNVKIYNIPYILLELTLNKSSEPRLIEQSFKALNNIIQNNTNLDALKLLLDRPTNKGVDDAKYEKILCLVVRRIHEILTEFHAYKKKLIEDKTLKKLIKLKSSYKSLEDELKTFYDLYSSDIMNYYSDEYEQKIKEQVLANLS